MLKDVSTIIPLLIGVQPGSGSTDAARAAKRARLDGEPADSRTLALILLLETLGSIPLPTSVELISCLLDVMSKVIHDTSGGTTDKSYAEQLVMSVLENAAANFELTCSCQLDALAYSSLSSPPIRWRNLLSGWTCSSS